MSTIDFTGVNSPEAKASTFKSVKSGIHTLTIAAVDEVTASTGTPGIEVTFDSKEAEASFKEKFWLSAGALPRVVYLMEKFAGAKPEGAMSVEEIAAKLVGTTRANVVVDARVITKNKDGKTYENEYAQLRFAGYVDPQGNDATPRLEKVAATPDPINVDDDLDNSLPF